MRRIISILTLLTCIEMVQAQDENQIDPVEIKIVKDYNVFIEEASKIQTPIHYYPKFKDAAKQKKITYNLPDRIEQFKFEPAEVEPIGYRMPKTQFNNSNFLRLGLGSAINPLVEWSHIQTQAKSPSRIHLLHHSAWKGNDSFQKYSETNAEASIETKLKQWSFTPKIQLNHKLYNFYGNLLESGYKSESQRNYGNIAADITLEKNTTELQKLSIQNKAKLLYGLDKLSLLGADNSNKEFLASLQTSLGYKLRESIMLNLDLGGQYYNLAFDTFTDKWIAHIMPNVEYRNKALKISGGLDLTQSLVNSKSIFYILPKFVSEVQLLPDYLNFYTLWNRNLDINSMHHNLRVNPFILYDNRVVPNSLVENRTAGLKGVYKGISYHAFFNQRIIKNALLFKNDATNPRYLTAEYEKNMTCNNIALELNYLREKHWSAFLKGDIFLYELDNLPLAYNLPAQKLTLGANLLVKEKLNLMFNTFALGGVKSIIGGTTITTPVLFDLNLGAELHISKNFYIFANANNILNTRFAPQVGYPSIGVNGQGGIRLTY